MLDVPIYSRWTNDAMQLQIVGGNRFTQKQQEAQLSLLLPEVNGGSSWLAGAFARWSECRAVYVWSIDQDTVQPVKYLNCSPKASHGVQRLWWFRMTVLNG